MKRTGRLLDAILDRENLRRAFHLAGRCNRDHPDFLYLRTHLDRFFTTLAEQVRAGTFPLGRVRQFVILDPKERLITAPCFEERVLHHAIMNLVEPHFERRLIFDTYACRAGKGRERAVQRAVHYAGRHAAFLKFDVRRYFDSIDHEKLLTLLGSVFKDRAFLALLERIVRAFRPAVGRGLPIGSLMSQHLANFYLNSLDRFARETLRLPGYVRYMDNVAVWSDDLASLGKAETACTERLAELGLTVKPSPYRNRTAHGMDFLGCRVLPHHAVLNRRSKTRVRRKLGQLERLAQAGEISEGELQERATSLIAFTRSAGIRSWKFRRRVVACLAEDDLQAQTA